MAQVDVARGILLEEGNDDLPGPLGHCILDLTRRLCLQGRSIVFGYCFVELAVTMCKFQVLRKHSSQYSVIAVNNAPPVLLLLGKSSRVTASCRGLSPWPSAQVGHRAWVRWPALAHWVQQRPACRRGTASLSLQNCIRLYSGFFLVIPPYALPCVARQNRSPNRLVDLLGPYRTKNHALNMNRSESKVSAI